MADAKTGATEIPESMGVALAGDRQLWRALNIYCEMTGVSRSVAVRRALRAILLGDKPELERMLQIAELVQKHNPEMCNKSSGRRRLSRSGLFPPPLTA